MKDLISRQLVKYLEDRGVEHIFGLCGHTNIAVLAALEKSSIKFVNTRHEQVAAHAADGYARAKRQTAVLLTHLGPGLTNAATGVANASLDSIPLVVIAGDVPSHYYGKHPHQEVNLHADAAQSEIYRPFVKRAWRVERPELFPEIIEKAFQLAESGRPGPVLVSVPMDIFSREVDVALFERLKLHTKKLHKPSIDDETATRIVQMLAAARNPLIHVGGGVVLADATAELAPVRHSHGHPGVAQPDGQGRAARRPSFDTGHDRLLGHPVHQRQVPRGRRRLRPGHPICGSGLQFVGIGILVQLSPGKLIHIDIDPSEIGRNYPVEIGAVADLKQALTVLNRIARKLYPEGRRNSALEQQIAANREVVSCQPPGGCAQQCLPAASRTHPGRRAGGAAAQRAHHHGRRLEQERRRPAVSGL